MIHCNTFLNPYLDNRQCTHTEKWCGQNLKNNCQTSMQGYVWKCTTKIKSCIYKFEPRIDILSLSVASKAGPSRLEVQICVPVNLPSGKLTTTSASSRTKKTINNPIFRIRRNPPEINVEIRSANRIPHRPANTATLTFRFAAWIPHRPANRYAASPILSISLHRDVHPRQNKTVIDKCARNKTTNACA